jgi:SLT domain-containing protein
MDGETINKNFAKAFNDIVNKYDNAAAAYQRTLAEPVHRHGPQPADRTLDS